MAVATVNPGLRASTAGVAFTGRNTLRTRGGLPAQRPSALRSSVLDRESGQERLKSPTLQVANPNLSVIDIENMLRERITRRSEDLYMAFYSYDTDKSLSVTKGEFRRVLESYCLSMTTEQFESIMNKVKLNPNNTVQYCVFMEKFGANRQNQKSGQTDHWVSSSQKYIRTQSPKEMNTDMIEKMLKEKIQTNIKNVIKGLRLYDYNHDGHIQKHELRKVLENYCFRMTDQQFDKLYQRYDFHHRGLLNYMEFLQRLGLRVEDMNKRPSSQGIPSVFNWQEYADQQRAGKTPQLGINIRPRTQGSSATDIAGMGLHSVEVEFRKQMHRNYTNIKRMFFAFDQHLDGFINLKDLKSVLDQFTVPMSDQLFSQLMDRCGVKASGKISWESFLEKFQDAQTHGNGQTITIKPAHKFNPIRGSDESLELSQIVKLLVDQVHNGYSTLKQAFLEIDKNRDGNITRKELKKVLNTFKVRITDDQFRELYKLLDPTDNNVISYHHFLDLFEERETKEGHKWLKSCHRFNDKQKPVILAWETVEEILRDKIQQNWNEVATAIVRCDNRSTQRIYPKELRRSIETFCIPISDDHFTHLISKMDEIKEGKINYVEFLTKLGVTIKPGDLEGLSTQIHNSSNEAESRRINEQNYRQARSEQRAEGWTGCMTIDEIIARVKDHMSQGTPHIRKAFLKYDTKKNGKVSQKAFRKILESFGLYMSDDQFVDLCGQLNFTNGIMTYSDFIDSFEDLRSGGPAAQLTKDNNHRVNKIRGDEYGLTSLEVESKLRGKLRENFEDLRGAFYKFDEDHNGFLTRGNFRQMLDAFMCPMADAEFHTLCERLGVGKKERISYQQFLEKFEVRDTEEGHKWLISDHKYNGVQPVKLMTADQAHDALIKKAHQQYADLSKAFRMIDTKKKGVIKKADLRVILQKFTIPMKNEEFHKLWDRYDPEGTGHVTHEAFLKRLVGNEFAPSDLDGMSYKIIKESYKKLDRHHRDQRVKHDTMTVTQAHHGTCMHVDVILQELKDRIREQYPDYYTAFKKYDGHKRGYLTSSDIQKVLMDFNYFVDDDQFYDLLDRLGLHEKRRLTYEDFLRGFQEGRKDAYKPKDEDVSFLLQADANLAPEAAVSLLHGKITAQLDVLQKAFLAFDRNKTGHLLLPDFRRVIENFCFKLSETQFRHLVTKLPMTREGSVEYPNFIETFKMSEIDADKWLDTIKKNLRSETPQVLSEEEVTSHLREQVAAKFNQLSRAFADIDYARIGVVSKEDFQDVLNQFTIRLNEDQFDKFWASQNVSDFGNIDYNEFLRSYTTDVTNLPRPRTSALGPTPCPSRRPNTCSSELARMSGRVSALSGMSVQRAFTPMVNARNVESRLKDVVYKHWKDIQRKCRSADSDGTGQIPYDAFKDIMNRIDSSLEEEDLNILFLKYDLKNNNHFSYPDFLRHFVLTMQQQREATLLDRKKMSPHKIVSTSPGVEPVSTVARVRECVTGHWKDMKHDFSLIDHANTGLLSTDDFRQVLRNYNANLDEEEFHSLMSIYDKDLNGKVNYKNFLKAFLKAV